jgi:hypothetical protein
MIPYINGVISDIRTLHHEYFARKAKQCETGDFKTKCFFLDYVLVLNNEMYSYRTKWLEAYFA